MRKEIGSIILTLFSLFTGTGIVLCQENNVGLVRFSVPRGYFYKPFSVTLTADAGVSAIYYTTDGRSPDPLTGKKYGSPVEIRGTTVIKAAAWMNGIPGPVNASSYIFPGDIIHQPASPAGYPAFWGPYSDIAGTAIADYEMDPQIVNHPDYKDLIIPSLLSLPVVSISTYKGFLFSYSTDPDTGGIYIYTGANEKLGNDWERPVSVEYFIPGTGDGFQVNCGLQIQGGASRLAEKNPKHSFRLAFRNKYGTDKLRYPLFGEEATDDFNGIVLRASFGNTWRHWESAQRNRAQHIQDIWAKDTQLSMGQVSAHSKFVHLYLNGLYWGVYNFSERLDDDFMETYFRDDKENWDIIKDYNELMNGNMEAWNYLWTAVKGNISDNYVYMKLTGRNADGSVNPDYPAYVDPGNLIDYMLINFYGGNNDWDHHNWVAARNRVNPGRGFTFFCWDTEKIFENLNENYVNENNSQRPSGIFRSLLNNREFALLFADRVNLLLCNGGLLTPGPVAERWLRRADETDTAMIAESARWGDYRRDVHPWNSGPFYLYTYKEFWLPEKAWLINSYFPSRTQVVLNQLDAAHMLPDLAAPLFSRFGGDVEDNFRLTISAKQGAVYYSLDGSDPRRIGGGISAGAKLYDQPLTIKDTLTVQARTKLGETWSALTKATFTCRDVQPAKAISGSEDEFSAYPNPFREEVNIRYVLNEAKPVTFFVYSIEGMLVYKASMGGQSTGIHYWKWKPEKPGQGVYILRLSDGKEQKELKLVQLE